MKLTKSILILMPLALLLFGGCSLVSNDDRFKSTFRSTPPWVMPAEYSEEQKIENLHDELDSIASNAPQQEVLAMVLLNEVVEFDTIVTWLNSYDLRGGEHASLLVKRQNGGIAGISLSRFTNTYEEIMVELEPYENRSQTGMCDGIPDWITDCDDDFTPIGISNFVVYGTTSNFLRLWEENSNRIRGVASLGPAESAIGSGWRAIDIGEPLR